MLGTQGILNDRHILPIDVRTLYLNELLSSKKNSRPRLLDLVHKKVGAHQRREMRDRGRGSDSEGASNRLGNSRICRAVHGRDVPGASCLKPRNMSDPPTLNRLRETLTESSPTAAARRSCPTTPSSSSTARDPPVRICDGNLVIASTDEHNCPQVHQHQQGSELSGLARRTAVGLRARQVRKRRQDGAGRELPQGGQDGHERLHAASRCRTLRTPQCRVLEPALRNGRAVQAERVR